MKSNFILVTGCSGFIGFHLCQYLLKFHSSNLIGIDNLNNYYDIKLKKNRLKILKQNSKGFIFYKIDIANKKKLSSIFKKYKFSKVINLAAQAGVRFSLKNRDEYFNSNILGFYNILELCKEYKIKHLLFASSSSVYGKSKKLPYKENHITDNPISFYAASKKSNEILAYPYAYIYKLKITGMRFFTVYGPFGRPDMAPYKFVSNLINKQKINLFNKGNHFRDFTYIDDVVNSIVKIINQPPSKIIPYEIVNIGRGKKVHLLKFLKTILNELKISNPKIEYKNIQIGDVHSTSASVTKLKNSYGYEPKISIDVGVKKFIAWFKNYNNLNGN